MPFVLNRETGTREFVDKTQLQQGQIGGAQPIAKTNTGGMDTSALKSLLLTQGLGDFKNISKYSTAIDLIDKINPEPPKVGSAEKGKIAMGSSGLNYLNQAKALYEEDPSNVTKQLIPGQYASRAFDNATFGMVENLLRLKSGAAVPESEVRRYMTKLAPSFGDSPEVIEQKFNNLNYELSNFAGAEAKPIKLRVNKNKKTTDTGENNGLMSIPGKLFPETMELGKQAFSGTLDYNPSLLETLIGPGSMLFRKDQVGKATREIGSSAALSALIGGAGKLVGKGVKAVGSRVFSKQAASKLTAKGLEEATEKVISGDNLVKSVTEWLGKDTTPVSVKTNKAVIKQVANIADEYVGKKIPLEDARQLFINLKSSFGKSGDLKKLIGPSAVDPVVRSAIRSEFERVGAGNIMKGIETAAKGTAFKETVKKYAAPAIVGGSAIFLLNKLLNRVGGVNSGGQ